MGSLLIWCDALRRVSSQSQSKSERNSTKAGHTPDVVIPQLEKPSAPKLGLRWDWKWQPYGTVTYRLLTTRELLVSFVVHASWALSV